MSAERGLDRPHVFLPADDPAAGPPLLLLHGTGGNEYDLLPLRDHQRVIRTPESREVLLARLPSLKARAPNLMQGLDVETVYRAAAQLLQL